MVITIAKIEILKNKALYLHSALPMMYNYSISFVTRLLISRPCPRSMLICRNCRENYICVYFDELCSLYGICSVDC